MDSVLKFLDSSMVKPTQATHEEETKKYIRAVQISPKHFHWLVLRC